jgi:hypothetical protein
MRSFKSFNCPLERDLFEESKIDVTSAFISCGSNGSLKENIIQSDYFRVRGPFHNQIQHSGGFKDE